MFQAPKLTLIPGALQSGVSLELAVWVVGASLKRGVYALSFPTSSQDEGTELHIR